VGNRRGDGVRRFLRRVQLRVSRVVRALRADAKKNLGQPAANAYGIYLVHYAFVSWLQLALVKAHMAVVAKASLVFLGAVLLGWATTVGLRRVPRISRVI